MREEFPPKTLEFIKNKLPANEQLSIVWEGDQIALKLRDSKLSPLKLDLINEYERQVRYFQKNSPYKENLVKALGVKSNHRPQIFDATLGMGKDSMMLLAIGLKLQAYERNPWVYLLHLNYQEIHGQNLNFPWDRYQFFYGELDAQRVANEVVYFDPMYQEVNSKAAPKKNMRIFREAFAADQDALKVASELLNASPKRLVVKRSRLASLLLENPHHQIIGKSTRFDIY